MKIALSEFVQREIISADNQPIGRAKSVWFDEKSWRCLYVVVEASEVIKSPCFVATWDLFSFAVGMREWHFKFTAALVNNCGFVEDQFRLPKEHQRVLRPLYGIPFVSLDPFFPYDHAKFQPQGRTMNLGSVKNYYVRFLDGSVERIQDVILDLSSGTIAGFTACRQIGSSTHEGELPVSDVQSVREVESTLHAAITVSEFLANSI